MVQQHKPIKGRYNAMKKQPDLEYIRNDLFTTLFPVSAEGRKVYNQIALNFKDAFMVNQVAQDVMKQLRKAGYSVRKAKPVKMTNEELLEALES